MRSSIRVIVILAAAAVILASPAFAEDLLPWPLGLEFSAFMEDFSVETADGGTFTFSEALKEKDLVLINLWATWCGPCGSEFPYLEEAYREYQDDAAVIALSVEPGDTPEKLADYARNRGMTFPVGSDTGIGLGALFVGSGIPTTLIVDRYGVIVFYQVGAMTGADAFKRLFDALTGDDYTASAVLTRVPPAKPDVPRPDESALNGALGAGGDISFTSSPDPLVWPMVPAEDQGRSAVMSSNAGKGSTAAAVTARVKAGPDTALAFDLKTDTEPARDLMQILVDGEKVKAFSGSHDWMTWAVPLSEGEHEVTFRYVKDENGSRGQDAVWLDEMRLIPQEEMRTILDSAETYPAAERTTLEVLNANARRILFDDPQGVIEKHYPSQGFFIVPGDRAEVLIRPDRNIDIEEAFVFVNYDGQFVPLSAAERTEDGFKVTTNGHDAVETSGYTDTSVILYPSIQAEQVSELTIITLFADEDNVGIFLDGFRAMDETAKLAWHYADEGFISGLAVYTVTFTDQFGRPVPGCIVNFCTDNMCVPVTADENGTAGFTGTPGIYHLQVLRVPEGYEFDTSLEFYTEKYGGDIPITVTKR